MASFMLLSSCYSAPKEVSKAEPKGILLVGNPRSMTSVFEHYMSNRGDFKTYFEPVVFEYLKIIKSNSDVTLENIKSDPILEKVVKEAPERFFIKEHAHVFRQAKFPAEFAKKSQNSVVFILREPSQAVLSHYKLIKKTPSLTIKEHGPQKALDYKVLKKVFLEVKESIGHNPTLIDSNRLVEKPAEVIEGFCKAVNIPFNPKHLEWKKDPKYHAGEKYGWMTTVRKSTGFHKQKKRHSLSDPEILEEDKAMLAKLIEENDKIYQELRKLSV